MTNSYAIKHKVKNRYFAGFDNKQKAVWVKNIKLATIYQNVDMANAQSLLLVKFDSDVQRKPVRMRGK